MQIFVLGMHRSGTSVVTRLINLMGGYFGPESAGTGANAENPKGFWERRDVRDENDAVLWSSGADWWKVADFSLERVPVDAQKRFSRNVPKIIRHLDTHRPWVVKEPRFCLLFPMWRRHVETPVCVLVHRPPIQVAHSLQQRSGFPLAFGVALWERYLIDGLTASSGLPRIIVSYQRIIDDPVDETNRLFQKLTDIGVGGLHRLSETEIMSFVSTDHFHHQQQENKESGLLSPVQRELASAMASGRALDFVDVPVLSAPAGNILRLYEAVCTLPIPSDNNSPSIHAISNETRKALHAREHLDTSTAGSSSSTEAVGTGQNVLRNDPVRSHAEQEGLFEQVITQQHEIEGLQTRLHKSDQALDRARRTGRSRVQKLKELQNELESATARLEEFKAKIATLNKIEETRDRERARAFELQASVSRMEYELATWRETVATVETQRRNLEQSVEQLLMFLRTAQETVTGFLSINRRHFGPLGIWPRKPMMSSIQRFNALLKDVSGWTRRHRSELLVLVGRARASSPNGLAPGTARMSLESVSGRPSDLSPTPDSHVPSQLRRYGLTVAVIAWDVGHNPLGRAYMLAEALQRHYRVILLGPSFSRYGKDVWEPLRSSQTVTIPVSGASFPEFAETLEKMAPRIAADVIVACKPRLPSVQLGLLMKAFLNRPMIIDIDDFELSFFENRTPLSLDALSMNPGSDDLRIPYGETWTRFTESLLPAADGITVSNEVLQSRYGGSVVPHARDEHIFDPSLHDRAACRKTLGFDEHHRVVLFAGTPRYHKGVLEVLRAVKQLANPDYRMVVVGTPPDPRLEKDLLREGGSTLTLVRSQPFEKLPETVNAADLVCVLQDTESEISKSQLPAKIIDALAMGVPILASQVPPLEPLIRAGAVEAVDLNQLPTAIDQALQESSERRRRQLDRRGVFLANFSYSAICQTLVPLINSSLREPKPIQPENLSFIDLQRPPEKRPRLSAPAADTQDGTLDIVMFWKQNDTGLYGRRHDMLIKYLSHRPEVRRIAVFDHPVSIDFLQKRARSGKANQWRDVYRETMIRNWGLRDSGEVSHHCFVYSSNTRDVGVRRWPWPKKETYLDFLESRFNELAIDPGRAVFWYYPMNLHIPEIHARFAPQTNVVDIVDDHRTWPGLAEDTKERLTEHYRDVLGLADVAYANCEAVQRSMSTFHQDIRLVPNGCEMEPPPDLQTDPRFTEFRNLQGPKIGFVGNLEAKIDIGLLEYLAEQRPDWHLVLIGSTHMNPEVLRLDLLPNVHFQGIVRYPAVRAWIKEFDVALVPHLDCAQTRSMNPLKVLVYCSVGVPVVSANVRNLGDFEEFVYKADSREEFLRMVEHAIQEGRVRNQESLNNCLKRNSWTERVEAITSDVVNAVDSRREDGKVSLECATPQAPRVQKDNETDAKQEMKMENLEIHRIDLEADARDEGAHRKRTFRQLIRHLNLPGGSTVVDLGAGPCVFAKIASDSGFEVTAVDARTDRVPSKEDLDPIKFVQGDIRNFDLQGFDLIVILGLLYHLEIPDQLNLLKRSRGASTVVVDTQVHIPDLVCTPEPERFNDLHLTTDGYEGVEFTEARNPMAAFGNMKSFWHTENSILNLFDAAGFRAVTVVDPPYQSKHGARRFFLLRGASPQS